MPIPESQLDTWSGQGAITTSADTYRQIRAALESSGTGYFNKDHKIFLQGSYGNDTNIYRESDVDVVIQLNDTFFHDLSSLSQTEVTAFNSVMPNATYSHSEFKSDVLSALKSNFGSDVDPGGTKAIKVKPSGSRRSADVIVACQFRRYFSFKGAYNQNYAEGICFFNSSGNQIENFPKQHSANCTIKHQSTNRMFKPMVRIFKNLRTRLVSDSALAADAAPSYYIEGLLYNAPASCFCGSYGDSICSIINWFNSLNATEKQNLVCANEQYYLLRDYSLVCWSPAKCEAFFAACSLAWVNW